VYGQPPNAVALSAKRLTADEAQKIARLIARLLELSSSNWSETGTGLAVLASPSRSGASR